MARANVLLVAVVAFMVVGVGAFAYARATTGGPGPVLCGEGARRYATTQCIPGIPGDAGFDVLADRGFVCSRQRRFCELGVGSTLYRVDIVSNEAVDGLIADYTLDVRHDPVLGLSPSAMGFLTWFMALPFEDDPDGAAASRAWLTEHVGGDHEAKIRGFDFRLAGPESGHVQLLLKGIGDPGPPRDMDGNVIPFPTPPQAPSAERD